MKSVLSGHAGPVTVADGLQFQTDEGKSEIIIATTSVDLNVKIWKPVSTDFNGK